MNWRIRSASKTKLQVAITVLLTLLMSFHHWDLWSWNLVDIKSWLLVLRNSLSINQAIIDSEAISMNNVNELIISYLRKYTSEIVTIMEDFATWKSDEIQLCICVLGVYSIASKSLSLDDAGKFSKLKGKGNWETWDLQSHILFSFLDTSFNFGWARWLEISALHNGSAIQSTLLCFNNK